MKKNIETVQGADVYPAAQQMLIHQGKVLKDSTTLEENKVAENSFIVIMLTKVTKLIYLSWKDCVNNTFLVDMRLILLPKKSLITCLNKKRYLMSYMIRLPHTIIKKVS